MNRPVPSFYSGYATHERSRWPYLWKKTKGVYAPFLGRQGNKLFDFSGLNSLGNIIGATWVGRTLSFNGSSNFVEIDALVKNISSATQGYVGAWVNPANFDAVHYIFSVGNSGSLVHFLYLFIQTDGTVVASVRGGETSGGRPWLLATDNPVITLGRLNYVVLRHNSVEPEILVDGIKPAQTFTTDVDRSKWFSHPTIDRASIGILGRVIEQQFFEGVIEQFVVGNIFPGIAQIKQNFRNPHAMFEPSILPRAFILPAVVPSAIMNQLQGPNLGADLFNGPLQ